MKKLYVLICFLFINISCDETFNDNWKLIYKILRSPDSLSVILNDSNFTYSYLTKVAQDTFYFNGIKNHIIENFQGEFDVLNEKEANVIRYINPPESKIVGRFHKIILTNTENNEILFFMFQTINGKWKLVRLSNDISTPLL